MYHRQIDDLNGWLKIDTNVRWISKWMTDNWKLKIRWLIFGWLTDEWKIYGLLKDGWLTNRWMTNGLLTNELRANELMTN